MLDGTELTSGSYKGTGANVSPERIQAAVRKATDQQSFITDLLVGALGWEIAELPDDLQQISYGWSAEELNAQGLDKKLVDGHVLQLQPLVSDQPWGIFILEFRREDPFKSGRGFTGLLRQVLRGLVPKRRRDSRLASWNREHLLFICTHQYKHFRFAYFKLPHGDSKTAPLAMFGWDPGAAVRTLCDFNLPALTWPEDPSDADKWVEDWAQAFNVEKVTDRFYRDYSIVFNNVERLIKITTPKADAETVRLFTQTLFNRLMFLRFIERKGWLELNGRKDYLRALHDAGPHGHKSFFLSRLKPLFFQGLALEDYKNAGQIGNVPFLNGGLFEETGLDRSIPDVPDEAFAGIVGPDGLFYRYNFTVEESTPFDIEVAVDPEMLGKVFEELVSGRHESGSYYTPRPIVSFMCREALKGYLEHRVEADAAAIAALVDDRTVSGLAHKQALEIIKALDEVKAVDPACGSGAYLLGLLQELVSIYHLLYSDKLVHDPRSLYELKLRIITNNLYGVDIDPFAVNIAMLRLWLSLSVDAAKPVPLPNLDFKIECGDSLLGPNPESTSASVFPLEHWARGLVTMKEKYLRARGKIKNDLRESIWKQEQRIARELHAAYGEGVIDWRVHFTEVFASRDGFDMVLANPPYVRQELIRKLKPKLREVFPGFYSGTADLYCYFYARALQLLRNGGMLVFISSNKWFRANYGKGLRATIAGLCQIRTIIDFGELPVFGASTFPMIFIAQRFSPDRAREGGQETSFIHTIVPSLDPPYPDVRALLAKYGQALGGGAVQGDTWRLTGDATRDKLARMERAGVPLGEYVNGRIYYGIKTGFNEAFVIDGATRARLIEDDPKSAEIIKPFAVGKDIRRWRIEPKDRWLIVTKIGVDIKRYPAVFRHLKHWQPQLERRQDQGEHWWELRACAYYAEFEKSKVVIPDIAKEPRFAFDKDRIFVGNTVYFIPSDDVYLCAILNSAVMWGYCCHKLTVLGDVEKGGRLRFLRQFVTALPIVNAPTHERARITALARDCIAAHGQGCEDLERELDERVATLYGL